ncbi:SMI1/KNR4 family protein [Streptomyces sp. NPDC048277]|uniref:SMI1/KNR4 family protein n=1 Tax=Streptomyces sp. NPDC048277 TaxID=3155027 RepID=UPI0033F20123
MDEIVRKLRQLDAADPGRALFGSATHGYRPGRPVGERELEALEGLVGVRLPEDYRAFLSVAGDGAPGPYYGILPLAEATGRITEGWGREALGADSPLTGDVDFQELLGGPEDWEAHAARLETDPDYGAGFERLQGQYLDSPWSDGRLPIADYGCGDWFFLVLRGPRRGTVWVDSLESATGMYCLETDFRTW